jgi:hypothetical protein
MREKAGLKSPRIDSHQKTSNDAANLTVPLHFPTQKHRATTQIPSQNNYFFNWRTHKSLQLISFFFFDDLFMEFEWSLVFYCLVNGNFPHELISER